MAHRGPMIVGTPPPPARLPMEDVRRILVLRMDQIGDFVLTTPLLQALRRGFPAARTELLVSRAARPLAVREPCVDEALVWDPPWSHGGGLGSWLRGLGVLAEIRRRRYDVAISLRRDADERLFLSLCGARWRVGYDRGRARRLLSLRVRSDPSGHVVERHLDMARALGCPTDGCRPRVVIRPGDRATARGLLQAIGGSRGARFVALAPGAGYATKLWGAREWAGLAERARFQWGATVLLLGGPGDREVARGIRERTAVPLWDLVGETSLPVAAAVLEGVDLLITVDSALMHIAAALGVPLVALFGPTLARDWGPWGPPDRCRVIEADVPCRECLRRWCPTHECMRSLTPARVAEAAEGLLHRALSLLGGGRPGREG